ncbi:MAG: ATP synthase F0 subunit B [Desulfobacterales bacterium]|jgi:F-type H+-transporting ATPase subunit b
MKIAGSGRHHRRVKKAPVAVIGILLVVLMLSAGFVYAATGGGHGSGEGSGAKGWVKTDWFRVINFVVLAGILFFVLRKPVTEALGSRIEGIKAQLADLEAQKEDAEKKLAAYNEKLSRLEKEAEKIVSDYIRQGNEAKARIIQEAEAAAEKLQSQARRNIEHEFERAKQQLQQEILEKSLVKAEEIIKGKITAKDQDRLVDEYLAKVVSE